MFYSMLRHLASQQIGFGYAGFVDTIGGSVVPYDAVRPKCAPVAQVDRATVS